MKFILKKNIFETIIEEIWKEQMNGREIEQIIFTKEEFNVLKSYFRRSLDHAFNTETFKFEQFIFYFFDSESGKTIEIPFIVEES